MALAGLIGYGAALASMDPATSSGDARFLIRTLVFGCVGGAAFVFYGRRMFHPRPWEDTFGLSVRFVGLTSVNVIQAWPFVVAMVRVWH